MTRRDQCYFVGKRAATLTLPQAAWAWHELAIGLENDLSQMDIPKFRHLLHRIRQITICAKQASGIPLPSAVQSSMFDVPCSMFKTAPSAPSTL